MVAASICTIMLLAISISIFLIFRSHAKQVEFWVKVKMSFQNQLSFDENSESTKTVVHVTSASNAESE
jgi:hypothetical protein